MALYPAWPGPHRAGCAGKQEAGGLGEHSWANRLAGHRHRRARERWNGNSPVRQLVAVPARRRVPRPGRPAQRVDAGHPGLRRDPRLHLFAGLHGRRSRSKKILRLPRPVRRHDGPARPGRQPGGAADRLDRRRYLQLSAHFVLARPARHLERGSPGAGSQRHRRWRIAPGRVHRAKWVRCARHLTHPTVHRRARGRGVPGVAAVRRRRGQIRSGPAVLLATERDGRPDADQCPDPRRHDGRRGRLSAGAQPRSACPGAPGQPGHCRDRRGYGTGRERGQPVSDKLQKRHRLLDRCPAGVHVRGGWRRRPVRRPVSPLHARLVQGAPVPGRRYRDPRRRWPRIAERIARSGPLLSIQSGRVPDRFAGADRHPAGDRRVVQQRRHHRRGHRQAADHWLAAAGGRHPDRPVYRPPVFDRLPGAAGRRPRRPSRRGVRTTHELVARATDGRGDRFRLGAVGFGLAWWYFTRRAEAVAIAPGQPVAEGEPTYRAAGWVSVLADAGYAVARSLSRVQSGGLPRYAMGSFIGLALILLVREAIR